MEKEIADFIGQLVGETIVGGDIDVEGCGFHLYTQNGLILIVCKNENNHLQLGLAVTETHTTH